MTTTAPTRPVDTAPPVRRGAASRMAALGRAELTLLLRSRAALITALLVPAVTTFSMRGVVDGLDLDGTGLSIATVLLPGSLGLALIFSVYTNLVGVYVTRRESLVLKRLRTGEVRDWEIFAAWSTPRPAARVRPVRAADHRPDGGPGRTRVAAPHLMVLGLLIGGAMLVAAGALTAAVTRTAESAQLTFLPFWLLSMKPAPGCSYRARSCPAWSATSAPGCPSHR